jgi:hypothetical protein
VSYEHCSASSRFRFTLQIYTFPATWKNINTLVSQKVSIFATNNSIAMDKKDNGEKARIHWTLALIPLAVLVALHSD